jgi:hypothetical protein
MPTPCNLCYAVMPSWENSDNAACANCGAYSVVRVFPAMFQPPPAPAESLSAAEGEATCYDHPSKRAVAHCSQCGRFVCPLCAVDFRGGVWCPRCIASGAEKKRTVELEKSRTLYDSVALTLALAPILFWVLTIFTGPASIFIALRYWKYPLSLVRRTRWRAVLAILIGLSQAGAWIWAIAYTALRSRAVR